MADTYLFKCHRHGQFEVKQTINQEHKADCPECKIPAERIFTPVPHIWEPYDNPNHPERRGVEG